MKKCIAIICCLIFICSCQQSTNKITLGCVIPLTGNSSDLGSYSLHAIQLCVDEWNNKGGINNNLIEIDANDSQADPKLGISLTQKMMMNKKPLLVYSLISGVTLNVQNITKQNKSILMACVGSAELFKNDTLYTLRNFVSPSVVGEGIATYIQSKYSNYSLSIFYVNNTFGESYCRSVMQSAQERNLRIRQSIPYDDTRNYKDIIAKSSLSSNDIVYIAGVGQNIGLLIKQLRETGFSGIILGDPNLPNASAINVAGNHMNNVYYLDILKPQTSEYNLFISKFKQKYSTEPDNFAIIAYITTNFILNIANDLKSEDTMKIIEAAKNYTYHSIIGDIFIKKNEFIFPTSITSVL